MTIYLAGVGHAHPPHVIDNETLVAAYNAHVAQYNAAHPDTPKQPSSAAFIEKASGIKQRYVLEPEGILDPTHLKPRLSYRPPEALSYQAELALEALHEALAQADVAPERLDGVIMSCSNQERPYPGIAVECQKALGAKGFAFDMQAACSSITFGIHTASALLNSGQAKRIAIVSVELSCAQVDYGDRDSHFIFGDAAAACVLVRDDAFTPRGYEVLSSTIQTQFSNNIRCEFGYTNPVMDCPIAHTFHQEGRKVFKEVVPWVEAHLKQHLSKEARQPSDIQRLWTHQANGNMNRLIASRLLGDDVQPEQYPLVLDQYANTGSAGCLLALYHHGDLPSGAEGVLTSFGAGYSVGSVLLKRV